MSFDTFDLSPELRMGLSDLKFESPTPIQEECIPLILEGHDVIGAAQTGTGKTGAFVIPVVQRILNNRTEHTQALILSPTRELAQQIDEQIFALGYHTGITSATVIGGSDFAAQSKAIRAGVDIIVATPGRLLDQMNIMSLDFSHLNFLVLDEADRMLDMGFLPDVMKIVNSLPKERQTLLFSATMDSAIMKVVRDVMKDPKKVKFEISKPVDSVDQRAYFVHPAKKLKLIEHLFDTIDWSTAIIFTATKRGTDELEKLLKKRDIPAVSMHGDRSQDERNAALRAFKNKTYPVMVATDVLSRGIDIENVSVIINYDVPNTPDDYIHRVGRTGRFDKEGMAITLVSDRDKRGFSDIQKVVGDQVTIIEYDEQAGSRETSRTKDRGSDNRGKGSNGQAAPAEKKSEKSEDRKSGDSATSRAQGETDRNKSEDSGQEAPAEKPSVSGSDGTDSSGKSASSGRSAVTIDRDSLPERPGRSKRSKRTPRQDKGQDGSPVEESGLIDKELSPEKQKEIEKKLASGRSGPRRDFKENKEQQVAPDAPEVEVIEKAVSRNKKARKPSKGIWGVVKSMIPKITSR